MALNFKQLCELFDCKQAAALRRVLKARGIRWSRDRKGKPWTTEAELDRAISTERRTLTFTDPPCRKNKKNSRSPQACMKNTALGTSSSATTGENCAV